MIKQMPLVCILQRYHGPTRNMLTFNRLANVASYLAVVALLTGARVEARTRKGDRLITQSRAAELRKDWDTALKLAEEALSDDPADVGYQLTTTRLRFYDAQYHVDEGRKLRNQGKLDSALAEFQKAYGINPASAIAEEEIDRTRSMIEREKTKPAATAEERSLTPAELEKQREQKKFASMQPLPELKPLNAEPISLRMNNQPPKVLFETVGKLAGVNVLFDPEFSGAGLSRTQSIELTNATLNEALDYLALVTKSYWKPISANTIFVTLDNPNKRREFEDWAVKVFYLRNVLTAQEMQEIVTTLRTVAEIRMVMNNSAQNAIIVRAPADKLALAEKLVADLDKPRPEVLVDVLVMTVNRNKERDLAAAVAPTGINSPIVFTPRQSIATPVPTTSPTGSTGGTTPAASNTIPLSNIARISTRDFSMTLPGGLLNALLTDADTKVLQAPQVRAVDGAKVEMKIGDRVPYATGSFQPGIGGVGINPLVNTQFAFLDTGVNITITPKIHGADEVSLHVEMDISNVTTFVPLGGINEPEVAQTKVLNDVRLKQGEVNLMGGLMQVEEDKSVSGVPGLGNIPILRRLFTSETVTKKQSELVIVLIPHIVRAPEIDDTNTKVIASGSETNVRLNYSAPKPVEAPPQPQAAQPSAAQPAPVPVPVPVPGAPAPEVVPAIPGVNAPPVTGPGATHAQPPATAPPAPSAKPETQRPSAPATVKFVPSQLSAPLNGAVTVSLMVDNANDLASAPLVVHFDPKILRLNDVLRGNLLASDGQQLAFSKSVLNDTGEATVNLSRSPGTGGVSGSGSIVTLVFQAVGRGDTVVTIPKLTLRNSQSQPILTATPQFAVSVK
jgi:general secretion pathway protein D